MLMVNQLTGFGSSVTSLLPLSLTFQSSALSTESSGRTFNSATTPSFGSTIENGNNRYILVLCHSIWGSGGQDGWTNSCTIGGVTATKLFRSNTWQAQCTDCWYILNNSLTSGNINVGWSGTGSEFMKMGFGVYTLVNPASITPTETSLSQSATSVAVSVNRSVSQVGLALASPNNDSGGQITWTNATSNYNILGNGSTYFSGAILSGTGTFNVTGTQGASGNIMRVTAAVWN
jgi:hypothetical protein